MDMLFPTKATHPKRRIPYRMFDREAFGLEAKNARVLERIYHKGQRDLWDGKEVLSKLIAEHGPPRIAPDKKKALSNIFGIILWGELAAWKISAELADELDPFEAKLAATSQAHDEARHFYVMHDYLVAAGALPDRMDWGAETLLESILNARNLAQKLMGMQLMVEPVALALFHVVRQLEVDPVLTRLLPYYERDESRHVALGIQYLPAMLAQMPATSRIGLWLFQFKLMFCEVLSQSRVARDMHTLGFDPRELFNIAKGKQMRAQEMVFESLGKTPDAAVAVLGRAADVLSELGFPEGLSPQTQGGRLARAWRALLHGIPIRPIQVVTEVSDAETPLVNSARAEA
jgi:hypothetical protein